MSRCVIIGGGEIRDYAYAAGLLRPDDWIVAADRGYVHACNMGVRPDLLVGDFDSYTGALPDTAERMVLPREKDDTDMLFAVRQGIHKGLDDFLLLGSMGGRLDHTLANIAVLRFLKRHGCQGILADRGCFVRVAEQERLTVDRIPELPYLSVFALGGDAEGVTLSGVKYPLKEGRLTGDFPIGCSNEIVDEQAAVEVRRGAVIVLQCADRLG